MSEKKSLIPALRFPEFRNDKEWDLESLSSFLAMPVTYGIVTAGEFLSNGVPMVRGGDIKGGNVNDNLPFVSEEKHYEYRRTILQRNDVIIALVGYPGEAAVVPNNLVGANISRAVGLIRLKGSLSPKFLVSYLNSTEGRAVVLKPSAGSAQIVVNLKELNKLITPVPIQLNEQQKIADCLSSLDDLITAQNQKVEALKQHKKSLMQHLFPAEGETIPKLRFPEFENDGEWNEIKLSELLETVIDNRGKTPPLSEGGYPLVEVNALGQKSINYEKICKYVNEITYQSWFRGHVKAGDVLFSTVGAIAECSLVGSTNSPVIAQNIVGLRFNQSVQTEFAIYLLTLEKNKEKFIRITMGAVQPSLKVSQMVHLKFMLPKLNEQTKIAECLSSLDELITIQIQQLEAYKAHKKGLMQQLFPALDDCNT